MPLYLPVPLNGTGLCGSFFVAFFYSLFEIGSKKEKIMSFQIKTSHFHDLIS
jgi:hypothetical protein